MNGRRIQIDIRGPELGQYCRRERQCVRTFNCCIDGRSRRAPEKESGYKDVRVHGDDHDRYAHVELAVPGVGVFVKRDKKRVQSLLDEPSLGLAPLLPDCRGELWRWWRR